jgi:hypothetical protein
MLDVVRSAAHRRALAAAFDVEILSLATANPRFRLPQSEAAVHAKQLYPQLSKLCRLLGIGGNLRNREHNRPLFSARIAIISSV